MFILVSLQTYTLQVVHGRLFGMVQGKAHPGIHALLPAWLAALPPRSLVALAQHLGVTEADAATVVVPLQEESAPGSPIPAVAPASPKTLLHRKKPWYPDLDVKERPDAASSSTSPCSLMGF